MLGLVANSKALIDLTINKEDVVNLKNFLTASLLLTGLSTSTLATATATATAAAVSMPDEQKTAIEKIIHDYLVAHPEVLIEASQALQQQQQQVMQKEAQKAIETNADALFAAQLVVPGKPNISVVGNPNGKVTLVEFFDYQCIHCKKMAPVIKELIAKNESLRVIYKEFPIFGKSSETASRVALAAAMQGKYRAFHEALIQQQDKRLTDEIVMNTARAVGLDMKRVKADMESKSVANALKANRDLADKLHLLGTPAFIIAPTHNGKLPADTTPVFIPGAASQEAMQDFISKALQN